MNSAIEASLCYLVSKEAQESIERDPYWPKWDSPWWHMQLLWEMGMAGRIPKETALFMARAMDRHYVKFFPFKSEELPAGKTLQRHVVCHCALGNMYQVLHACGVDVDKELPWARPWFLKYQMVDGGLNCDEAAYLRPAPKSSVLSTVPPLEAVLLCTKREFTKEETDFLDRGADYLIKRRLFRSASKGGQIIDPAWLEPCFPRFYDCDILRGLKFLERWSGIRRKPLPKEAVSEAQEILKKMFSSGFTGKRQFWREENSINWNASTNSWERGPSSAFPLLLEVSQPAAALSFLTNNS